MKNHYVLSLPMLYVHTQDSQDWDQEICVFKNSFQLLCKMRMFLPFGEKMGKL